ncbi:ABC transporter permease [Bacillus solimangrovi]|uniref:ABC transporter permease n=1 Tax=Bacillus solimangrovi TaxID=1305675 RepID=A0A1E5LE40_9BACI|nr:ABC transporter permease [Bacillus solimangrovi]OEH92361.1 ABC transporter permease [Bacillus solimangrovi]
MKGLLQYQLLHYIRTYRYLPPFTFFIMFLVINYAYKPNPILDSYSFTSVVLFFIMGWFTVTIFHAEDSGQRVITQLHCKSSNAYYISLYIIAIMIGFCLSVLSVYYPIIFDMFAGKQRLIHVVMGVMSHFSSSILAISLTSIFTRDIVKNDRNTWWGVFTILLTSLIVVPLKTIILQVKGLIWLLPPVHLSLQMMSTNDSIDYIPFSYYLQFSWIALYGFIMIVLFFQLKRFRQA